MSSVPGRVAEALSSRDLIRGKRSVPRLVVRKPQRDRSDQSLAAHVVGGKPDAAECFQKPRLAIVRFATWALAERLGYCTQQANGIFALLAAQGAEFVQDLGFACPHGVAIPVADRFQKGTVLVSAPVGNLLRFGYQQFEATPQSEQHRMDTPTARTSTTTFMERLHRLSHARRLATNAGSTSAGTPDRARH